MTEPTNSPTTAASKPTQSTHLVPKSVLQQRASVYQTFQNLDNKSKNYASGNNSYNIVSVDTNRETWIEVLNRLQFNVLPTLQQQLNALPNLLDLSELRDDMDGSKLQLITEIQSELDQSINQILSIVAGIKLKQPSSLPRADDNDLKELKHFTRKGLLYKLEDLNGLIGYILKFCSDTMRELNEGTSQSRQTGKLERTRWQIISFTTTIIKSINQLIKWIASHEFINIQEDWARDVSAQEELIAEVTERINRTINYSESKDDDGELSDEFEPLEKNQIPLAQSLIPIIKLSRLFFKKIARDGLNKQPLKPFTDMNSYQLDTLRQSARLIHCDLTDILSLITGDYDPSGELAHTTIADVIDKFIHRFNAYVLLAIVYIIPLVPNSRISLPNDLQTYLIAWNNLFLIATQNCARAAQAYITRLIAASLSRNQ